MLQRGLVAAALKRTQKGSEDEWTGLPAYNIAPTQRALVFRHLDRERHADELRWGLIPTWSKDDKSAFKAINARSETVCHRARALC